MNPPEYNPNFSNDDSNKSSNSYPPYPNYNQQTTGQNQQNSYNISQNVAGNQQFQNQVPIHQYGHREPPPPYYQAPQQIGQQYPGVPYPQQPQYPTTTYPTVTVNAYPLTYRSYVNSQTCTQMAMIYVGYVLVSMGAVMICTGIALSSMQPYCSDGWGHFESTCEDLDGMHIAGYVLLGFGVPLLIVGVALILHYYRKYRTQVTNQTRATTVQIPRPT